MTTLAPRTAFRLFRGLPAAGHRRPWALPLALSRALREVGFGGPSAGRRRGIAAAFAPALTPAISLTLTLTLALTLALVGVGGGCAAPPAAPPASGAFPTLSEIAPAVPIRPPIPEDAATRGPGATASLLRVSFPLDLSIEPAWAQVDENVLPPLTRGVWRANGLRAGVIPGERLEAFLDELPPVWSDRLFRIGTAGLPRVVGRSAPLIRPVTVDLTVPPFAPRVEELLGRRVALLMELAPGDSGLVVTLTPLHQRPMPTVVPRTAAEKELDGRLFTELAIRLTIPRGSHAVVGLARDPSGLPTAAEIAAEAAPLVSTPQRSAPPLASDTPSPPSGLLAPTPVRLDPPPLPAHLGRALFTAVPERRGEPQLLLLITP